VLSPPPAAPVLPPPPPPPPEPSIEPAGDADSHWPVLVFHARVLTGFEVDRLHPEGGQQPVDETQPEFFLDQAVIEAEAELSKRLHVELGFNLRNATVRDAFANYRVRDSLQLRIGRFKRPFSRLELRSRGKLPFRERGLFNQLVLIDGGFAGRALGAMLWGKPADNLRYSLAASNPSAIGSGIEGVDITARIAYDPVEWLSVGLNAMHKWTERFADGPNLSLHAVGLDARAVIGDLEILIEVDAAQNPNPPPIADTSDDSRTPWAVGAIAYADYAFKLSKKWTLAPVVVLEWMDTDTEYEKDERLRAAFGLSWNYKKNALRIMPQVEVARPLGGADMRGEVARETYYLLVSTEI
jgi:Phosphate-selective porin O and P